MERLFLNAAEVRALLRESRTTYYGENGAFHHPEFPKPVKRPGRAPVWFVGDIQEFAAALASSQRQSTVAEPLLRTPTVSKDAPRRRGRPRKPRIYEDAAGE